MDAAWSGVGKHKKSFPGKERIQKWFRLYSDRADNLDFRLIILLKPDSEESVVNAVDALFVRNKVFLEQSFEGRLHRARRRKAVLFDKFPGGDPSGFAFFIDGDEQLFLSFRQAEQDLLKGVIIRVENVL